MISERQFQLLEQIHNHSLSINELASQLTVSNQTVRTEIDNLNEQLADKSLQLKINKNGRLTATNSKMLAQLLTQKHQIVPLSLKKRIILLLLLQHDYIVIQDIADQLFVSKSVVSKVIPTLTDEFSDWLLSQRRKGVCFVGSEQERRKLFVDLLAPYLPSYNFNKYFQHFMQSLFDLSFYFTNQQIELANQIIQSFKKSETIILTDEAYKELFLYTIFILHETREQHYIDLKGDWINVLEQQPDKNIYKEFVLHHLEKFDLPASEKIYFTYLIIRLKKQKIAHHLTIVGRMKPILADMLKMIYFKLGLDLTNDKELISNLSLHLYTTINEATLVPKQDIDFIETIKYQYPLAYDAAIIASEAVTAKYQRIVNNDELNYLTIHFQAGIERLKKQTAIQLQTIIVCHYGLAASALIAAQLKNEFGDSLVILAQLSVQDYLQTNWPDIDLVISTETLEQSKQPILFVKPTIEQYEIQYIDQLIQQKKRPHIPVQLFDESLCIEQEKFTTVAQLLTELGKQLQESNSISQKYIDSMKQREQLSPTNYGIIAVPHGDPIYCQKSQLTIMHITEPIQWGNSNVHFIITLACTKTFMQSQKDILSFFYRLIAHPDVQKKLQEIETTHDPQSAKKVLDYLRKEVL